MSRIIIQDTREQKGKHKNIEKYCSDNGILLRRECLGIGDYTLPTDRSIAIDVKKDMYEIAGNLCSADHERFRNECIKAKQYGCKLYVLVEEPNINGLRDVIGWQSDTIKSGKQKGKPKTAVKGLTLARTMSTMQVKYGVKFLFCSKDETGRIIEDILYGD